jgi:hypothetical protein
MSQDDKPRRVMPLHQRIRELLEDTTLTDDERVVRLCCEGRAGSMLALLADPPTVGAPPYAVQSGDRIGALVCKHTDIIIDLVNLEDFEKELPMLLGEFARELCAIPSAAQPCKRCCGTGLINGGSGYGEPCPDCAPASSEPPQEPAAAAVGPCVAYADDNLRSEIDEICAEHTDYRDGSLMTSGQLKLMRLLPRILAALSAKSPERPMLPSDDLRSMAARAVEAQRNDTRTMDEKIRDGVTFVMGPDADVEQDPNEIAAGISRELRKNRKVIATGSFDLGYAAALALTTPAAPASSERDTDGYSTAKSWYRCAYPYATPEALKEALDDFRSTAAPELNENEEPLRELCFNYRNSDTMHAENYFQRIVRWVRMHAVRNASRSAIRSTNMYAELEGRLRRPVDQGGYDSREPDALHIKAADAIASLRTALDSQIEIANAERAAKEKLLAQIGIT